MAALEDVVEIPAEPDHDGVCSGGGDRRLLLGSQAGGAESRSDEPPDAPASTTARRPRGEQRQGLHSGLLKYVHTKYTPSSYQRALCAYLITFPPCVS